MVDNYGLEGDGGEPVPRGLSLGLQWAVGEGSVLGLEREYDGFGYLREVRYATAVKGGWSGGRM